MSYKGKPSQSFDVVKATTAHAGTLYIGGDPLNGVEGTSMSGTELAYLDGVTAGTVTASKAVVVDANKRVDTLVIAASGLKIGTGAGTAMTKSAAEINALVGGVAAGYKLARGNQAATASATIATGLTTITGFAVAPVGATATKINACSAVSASASSGNLSVYRWKVGGPSTTTLKAASVAGTVSWVAVGT